MPAALNLFGLKPQLVDNLRVFRYTRDAPEDTPEDNSDSDSVSDSDEEPNLDDLSLDPNAHLKGSPYIYYSSPEIENGQVLAVYKRWFSQESLEQDGVQALKSLASDQASGQSAVFLVGGGHFAGAIVQHKPKSLIADKNNPVANIVVTHHKSFHRYTTRRKQGGAQSASDNAHGKAKSAGSNIRRQQELALKAEIQQLIVEWSSELAKCHTIFYHAGGRSNRGIIISPNTPIAPGDERLRSIPLTTKRPTGDEIKRIWRELTMIRIVDAPDEAKPKPSPKPKQVLSAKATPEPTPEPVDPAEEQTTNVCAAIKKGGLSELKKLLGGNVDQELTTKATPTALLYAAKQGKHQVVAALLRWGADPAVKGKKLSELSNEKVAETLQTMRQELGEVRAWDKAGVGQPRTAEELQAEKDAVKKAEAEAQMKKFEKKEGHLKAKQIEKFIDKHGAGRQLGNQMSSAGLSVDEQRMVEREKRARAAEARLKRFQ